jgi:hypothetical protein
VRPDDISCHGLARRKRHGGKVIEMRKVVTAIVPWLLGAGLDAAHATPTDVVTQAYAAASLRDRVRNATLVCNISRNEEGFDHRQTRRGQ